MALDVGVFQNLQQPKPVDLLTPYLTLSQLKTMQLQQQDIAQQVEERRQAALKEQIANQKTQQIAQETQQFVAAGGQMDDTHPKYPLYRSRIYAIDTAAGRNLDTLQEGLKKTRAETTKAQADTAKTQQETSIGPKPEGGFRYNMATKQWEALPPTAAQQAEIDLKKTELQKPQITNLPELGLAVQTTYDPVTKTFKTEKVPMASGGTRILSPEMEAAVRGKLGNDTLQKYYAGDDTASKSVLGAIEQYKKDTNPSFAVSSNLSPGALDLMAHQALNGTFTSRNPLLTAKVYARAADIAQGMGLTSQQVQMQQNAAKWSREAGADITKRLNQIQVFSQTANMHMQTLMNAMNAVSDLGAPFLNTPLRNLQQKFAGDPRVTAFKTAMLPVQSEIAKALSGGIGSGPLTDHARDEVKPALNDGATPAMLKSAFDVIKEDLAQQNQTYKNQQQELIGQSVVGGPQGQGNVTPVSRPRAADGKGNIVEWNGAQWVPVSQ